MEADYEIISAAGDRAKLHFTDAALKDYEGKYMFQGEQGSLRIKKDTILDHWHTDNVDQFFINEYGDVKLIRITWLE